MAADAGSPQPAFDRLTRLEAELGRIAAQVAALHAAVTAAADLTDAIEALGTRVDDLAEQLTHQVPDRPGEPVPVAWQDVTPAQAPAMLSELASWVATVLAPYRVAATLLPCWYRHPGVVQLLLDARLAWLTAYRNPAGGRIVAALDWSQRHLPHLESRARELLGGCSTVRHTPPEPPVAPAAEKTLHAYARWWAGGREPGREPD